MHSKYNKIGTHHLISRSDIQLLVCCNFESIYFNYRTLPICYNKLGFQIVRETPHNYHIELTGVVSREHGYNHLNRQYYSKRLDMVVASIAQPEFGTISSSVTGNSRCLFLPGKLAEYDNANIVVPISFFEDFVQLVEEYNKVQEYARKDVYLC